MVGCRVLRTELFARQKRGDVGSDSADTTVTSIWFWDGCDGLCNTGGLEHFAQRERHSEGCEAQDDTREEVSALPQLDALRVLEEVGGIRMEAGIGSNGYLEAFEEFIGWGSLRCRWPGQVAGIIGREIKDDRRRIGGNSGHQIQE